MNGEEALEAAQRAGIKPGETVAVHRDGEVERIDDKIAPNVSWIVTRNPCSTEMNASKPSE